MQSCWLSDRGRVGMADPLLSAIGPGCAIEMELSLLCVIVTYDFLRKHKEFREHYRIKCIKTLF